MPLAYAGARSTEGGLSTARRAAQGPAPAAPPAPAQQPVPAYVAQLFDVVGKIGEGTYGVVYLAKSREPRPCLLAVKTFKPGKARPHRPTSVPHACRSQPASRACWWSRPPARQGAPASPHERATAGGASQRALPAGRERRLARQCASA